MGKGTDYTDPVLLEKIANGDEAAFRELFETYSRKLYSFLLDLIRSESQVEDIVQDVFIKIWQQRERLKEVQYINAYIFRVAQNHAIDQLRRLSRESKFLSSLAGHPGNARPVEDELVFKETEKILGKAIDQLPPQQRKVYQLHAERGMKHEEIAKELDLSVSTVQNHMFRALSSIRAYLAGNYPDASVYILILLGLSRAYF